MITNADLIESLGPLSCSTIVSYGIGHIGTCHIAQQQFALLLELTALCKPETTWIYDPILHQEEKAAIMESGCKIISRNEVCKLKYSGTSDKG